MSLDREFIRQLFLSKRGDKFADIIIVTNFLLDHGSFEGYMEDLAKAVGLSKNRVSAAITHMRTTEWKELHGYTIPYVGKGKGDKTWRIVMVAEDFDKAFDKSNMHRHVEICADLRRVKSHFELHVEKATDEVTRRRAQRMVLELQHYLDIVALEQESEDVEAM